MLQKAATDNYFSKVFTTSLISDFDKDHSVCTQILVQRLSNAVTIPYIASAEIQRNKFAITEGIKNEFTIKCYAFVSKLLVYSIHILQIPERN